MSSNKTTNYQLHSWEPGDDFLRTEFNENFSALDTAIKGVETGASSALAGARSALEGSISAVSTVANGKVSIVTGSYGGDGTQGRVISLGFNPKAVLIFLCTGQTGLGSDTFGGLFTDTMPLKCNGMGSYICAQVVTDGFRVDYIPGHGGYSNANPYLYYYAAIR